MDHKPTIRLSGKEIANTPSPPTRAIMPDFFSEAEDSPEIALDLVSFVNSVPTQENQIRLPGIGF